MGPCRNLCEEEHAQGTILLSLLLLPSLCLSAVPAPWSWLRADPGAPRVLWTLWMLCRASRALPGPWGLQKRKAGL